MTTTIYSLPQNFIRSASWAQSDQRRNLQRSEFTGRTRETIIGPADRWSCAADIRPMRAGDIETWRAFQAQMKLPGARVRLPATEGSQFPPTAQNLVQNSKLVADASGWVLPASVARTAGAGGTPIDWYFLAGSGSSRSINANGNAGVPVLPGEQLAVRAWAIRTTAANTSLAVIDWRNNAGANIGFGILAMASPVGQWQLFRGQFTAPALTASARLRFDLDAAASGQAGVGDLRVARRPKDAPVIAGSTAVALNLGGLAPSLTNLLAGQLLTIPLPSGDEQMVPLVAPLIANSSGLATAALGSPLREIPAPSAFVELEEPWGLMRTTDPLGWSVDPAPIYGARQIIFEEAF
jgi:hypothetical protein